MHLFLYLFISPPSGESVHRREHAEEVPDLRRERLSGSRWSGGLHR